MASQPLPPSKYNTPKAQSRKTIDPYASSLQLGPDKQMISINRLSAFIEEKLREMEPEKPFNYLTLSNSNPKMLEKKLKRIRLKQIADE